LIDLVVVRHGETDWNRVRRLQGHTDIALNDAGIEQASRLAAALAGESIGAIHSSDLARALATAGPVAAALGVPVVRDARLRERHYGILEGHTFEEIARLHPDEADRMVVRDPNHTIEGGESAETFQRRVVASITAIARTEAAARGPGAAILIVTHGGVLDMLYRHAHDIALDVERPCAIPNAVINRLTFDDGRFVVRSWAKQT